MYGTFHQAGDDSNNSNMVVQICVMILCSHIIITNKIKLRILIYDGQAVARRNRKSPMKLLSYTEIKRV